MPALTNEQLCAALKQGDRSALDALIEQNTAFLLHTANSMANQYRCPQHTDDLIQEGALGMMKAAAQYDPEREVQFLTYAGYWVRKYMRSYLDAAIDVETVSLEEVAQAREEAGAEKLYQLRAVTGKPCAASGKHGRIVSCLRDNLCAGTGISLVSLWVSR